MNQTAASFIIIDTYENSTADTATDTLCAITDSFTSQTGRRETKQQQHNGKETHCYTE